MKLTNEEIKEIADRMDDLMWEGFHNIIQNKTEVHIGTATITSTEHNVLMVALDHMYEHLDNLVGDLETFEEESTNLKRIDAVNSLKKLFKK
jgi:hypothetical protein